MKSKLKYTIYYLVVFAVFLANIVFFVKDQLFFSIKDLPGAQQGEEAVYSAFSPDLNKVAECYTVTTPQGVAVRVELVTYDENVNVIDKENIYWEVGKESVIIGWVTSDIITIDSRTLDLSKNETYDSRRIATLIQKW
ncbi:MAG: DUF5412 family protein [Acutalibacteraceae bacterium]|nr:DUF5412 family protein [Acutalibacteraceae bacterium]